MSKKLYERIGGKIRGFRKLAGLTQEQLAEKAELSIRFIADIEQGNAKPTLDSLEKLSSALEVKIEECFQFYENVRQETGELIIQIDALLKRCQPAELRLLKSIVEQVLFLPKKPRRNK